LLLAEVAALEPRAEIALAGQTRGQSGREPNIQLVTYPGAPNASCVESDGLFAASSLSTWQRHAGRDVRPGVDVTCTRREVQVVQSELGRQLAVGGLIPFTKRDCSWSGPCWHVLWVRAPCNFRSVIIQLYTVLSSLVVTKLLGGKMGIYENKIHWDSPTNGYRPARLCKSCNLTDQ
jgi:hypothetical protein